MSQYKSKSAEMAAKETKKSDIAPWILVEN